MEIEESRFQSRSEPRSDSNLLPIPGQNRKQQRSSTPLERCEPGAAASQEFTQSLSAVQSRSLSRGGVKENRVDPPPSYHSRESDAAEIFFAEPVCVPREEKCDRPPSGHNQDSDESPRRGTTRQSVGACGNVESDNIMFELLRQMQRTQQLQQEQINEQNRL
ncbi:MAG: hypothetical protein GY696_11795, partial [Gammaproteobacteria bacterium]|nr:hypothetical protein [Gammaproteobacteria bacterium]